MLRILSMYRRFVITGILIFFSLGFLMFFSESDSFSPIFQRFIVSLAFFLVIPLLYSKMVAKEPLGNLGLQRGNFGAGIFASIFAVVLASGIIVWLDFSFPSFREQYLFPALVQKSFFWFVFYELVLTTLVVLLYEMFFRGLIQLFWLKDFGMWAIWLQAGIFYGFCYLSSDFSWQKAPILLFCPLAGLVAYWSKSIWYSVIASWIFIFLTDVFFLTYR